MAQQKQSKTKVFVYDVFFGEHTKTFSATHKKAFFLSKVHLKVFCSLFFHATTWHTKSVVFRRCWWIFSPFSMLSRRLRTAIVVCASRRMFTIIWNTLRRSINVTMPTAHIFAIFHHNFFVLLASLVCTETRRFFFSFAAEIFCVVSLDETWKTPFNNFWSKKELKNSF